MFSFFLLIIEAFKKMSTVLVIFFDVLKISFFSLFLTNQGIIKKQTLVRERERERSLLTEEKKT
jgi:hypothetical protein